MLVQPTDQDIGNIFGRIENGIYDLQPDFQRDIVWNQQKQQKLIDSIMRGWHIPPIHLVKIEGKEVYEVLDGKQRLFSIYNFLNDKFTFNAKFIPGMDDFKELHGKKFSQFPESVKNKFLFTTIRIFQVTDVRMNEATELFLRLNLGVTVADSEKRNCIYGPVKNFLREIINNYPKLFCIETLGFPNLRMAYQDVLDKIFFLEKKGNLDNKPNSKALEKMYFEKIINEAVEANLRKNLKLLESVLQNSNHKLTKSTLMSYYWFLRDIQTIDNVNVMILSKFLKKFEDWRKNQEYRFENDMSVHNKYVEFETLLSEGWLDPHSLKGRHRILIDFYQEFLIKGKFGEVDDKI
ncbi:Uncharacterised protein [uncultured archaeon]|nr:Uncharacterised protein [uncultured archaeon]